jgi:hypothetical protein
MDDKKFDMVWEYFDKPSTTKQLKKPVCHSRTTSFCGKPSYKSETREAYRLKGTVQCTPVGIHAIGFPLAVEVQLGGSWDRAARLISSNQTRLTMSSIRDLMLCEDVGSVAWCVKAWKG